MGAFISSCTRVGTSPYPSASGKPRQVTNANSWYWLPTVRKSLTKRRLIAQNHSRRNDRISGLRAIRGDAIGAHVTQLNLPDLVHVRDDCDEWRVGARSGQQTGPRLIVIVKY